jgi:SAM-dependent methyltransferase
MTNDTYLFSQAWEQERARLVGLAAQFDRVTVRHLTDLGVGAGWRCLEVGAGEGSIARWLSAAVGPTGRVVATDIDTRFLDHLSGTRVEVARLDVTSDAIEPDAFDLVHARAVLEHVPGRAEVVARLVGALRPAGVLVLEDVVLGAVPPGWERLVSPAPLRSAMSRVGQAMAAGFRAVGADPEYGLELPGALTAAGLRDVGAEITHRLVRGDSAEAAFYSLSLREVGPRLIAAGLLSPGDVEQVVTAGPDPASYWVSAGLVSAWGRRR